MRLPAAVVALAALAATVVPDLAAAVPGKRATNTYCTPSQSCWPSTAKFSTFNSSIGGRLIKVKPWADPCFASPDGYNQAACSPVEQGYTDGITRGNAVGTAQNDNWAYCYSNQGDSQDCSLIALSPAVGPPFPLVRTCQLGRISPYAVNVASADDVVKALAFAKQYNIKVVIKNTGHEYLGRATAPDSLMIWTHNLNSLSYTDNFEGTGKNAVIMGSGVIAKDAYAFANKNNRYITLGAYESVGVAGGFAMGGGHGPLGPKYGLAVDNLLEYTVVTADGQVRKANANNNTDLFWAMRGGGGGVYGVAVETVYEVHPTSTIIAVAFKADYNLALVPGDKDGVAADYLNHMASYQLNWTKQGWAGYNFLGDRNVTFLQGILSNDDAAAHAAMDPFTNYVKTNPNFSVTSYEYLKFNSQVDFNNHFFAGGTQTPVAYSERLAGRLIPVSAFQTNASRALLSKNIVQAYRDNTPTFSQQAITNLIKESPLSVFSTGPLPTAFGGPSGSNTGVNTAWRDSIWEVVVANGWVYGTPQTAKQTMSQQTSMAVQKNLKQYGTGCYMNEADVLEPNWQTTFFGNNYQQLLSIKQKYDPDNMFIVFKGIGYAEQSGQNGFRCYQQP